MSLSPPLPSLRDVGGPHAPCHCLTAVDSPPATSVTAHNAATSPATTPAGEPHMRSNEEGCQEEGRGCKDARGVRGGGGWTGTKTPTAGHAETETRGNGKGRRIPAVSTRGSVQPTRRPFRARLLSQRRGGEKSHMPPRLFPPLSPTVMTTGRCDTHTPPFALLQMPPNKRGFGGVYSRDGVMPTCRPSFRFVYPPNNKGVFSRTIDNNNGRRASCTLPYLIFLSPPLLDSSRGDDDNGGSVQPTHRPVWDRFFPPAASITGRRVLHAALFKISLCITYFCI